METFHKISNFVNINFYMNHEESKGKPLVYIKFHDQKAIYNFKEQTFLKSNLDKTPELLVEDFCEEFYDEFINNLENKEYNWIEDR